MNYSDHFTISFSEPVEKPVYYYLPQPIPSIQTIPVTSVRTPIEVRHKYKITSETKELFHWMYFLQLKVLY